MRMGYRGFAKFAKGKSSPEHSILKLFGSETLQRALLVGMRGARASTRLDLDARGPTVWREGSWADAVPALVRRDDPRRHQRDPAQHHRRAGARPARKSR